jgi:hypothetical protein
MLIESGKSQMLVVNFSLLGFSLVDQLLSPCR